MHMGIEQTGGSGRAKENNESRKGKRKWKRQKPRELSPLQKLYHTCEEVFADCGPDIVPSPEKVERLAAILDGITQEDVGIRPTMQYFSSKLAPSVSYLPVHECHKFSIAILCFPPKSVIPLHNHPGMTVFSKILFGTVHIKAYDWANDMNKDTSTLENANAPKCQPEGSRLAKLKVESDISALSPTSILYPADEGNMHCFTAKTACAVLDVLGPPYGNREDGHCQYYHDFPVASCPVEGQSVGVGEVNGFAWLKEREELDDLPLFEFQYKGPKIKTIE